MAAGDCASRDEFLRRTSQAAAHTMNDNGHQGDNEVHSMNHDLYQRLLEIAAGMSTQRMGLRLRNRYFTGSPGALGTGWFPAGPAFTPLL